MRISFSPMRRDDALVVERTNGNMLRINGDLFNFNTMSDGDTIPAGEIPCEWIVGPVARVDGEVRMTLILPHGPAPHHSVAYPTPITVIKDGLIALPANTEELDNVDA